MAAPGAMGHVPCGHCDTPLTPFRQGLPPSRSSSLPCDPASRTSATLSRAVGTRRNLAVLHHDSGHHLEGVGGAKNTSRLTIQAPASKVWAALTEPALVKQWQYGSDLVTDWSEGNAIRCHSEWQGRVCEQWGKVQAVVPCQRIQDSLFAPQPGLEDRPANYFVMTYTLDEQHGVTTLTIDMDDSRPAAGGADPADEGGQAVLRALKATAESL